jgi:hypothetical protein
MRASAEMRASFKAAPLLLVLVLASCQQTANTAEGATAVTAYQGSSAASPHASAAPAVGSAAPARSAAPVEPETPAANPPVAERLKGIARLDPEAVAQYLNDLKAIVARGDRAAACALVNYPITIGAPPKTKTIASAASCEKNYERIFTPRVIDAIGKQQFADLFVNYQGVMIGRGEIWFGGICDNDQCTGRADIRIKTINE